MSVGGALPFVGKRLFDTRRLPLLTGLTLATSAVGAYLVTRMPGEVLGAAFAGYLATTALGVYGGLFSGGYVTVLTTVFVALFGMTFLQAVATTKVVNLGSSLVATAVYAWAGLIDWRLGALLSGVMFVGAAVGAKLTLRLDNEVVRRVFLGVVVALALKALGVDPGWAALGHYSR